MNEKSICSLVRTTGTSSSARFKGFHFLWTLIPPVGPPTWRMRRSSKISVTAASGNADKGKKIGQTPTKKKESLSGKIVRRLWDENPILKRKNWNLIIQDCHDPINYDFIPVMTSFAASRQLELKFRRGFASMTCRGYLLVQAIACLKASGHDFKIISRTLGSGWLWPTNWWRGDSPKLFWIFGKSELISRILNNIGRSQVPLFLMQK